MTAVSPALRSLNPEIDRHVHRHFHRRAVEQRPVEQPLAHRLDRRIVEIGLHRFDDLHVADGAIDGNRRFQSALCLRSAASTRFDG